MSPLYLSIDVIFYTKEGRKEGKSRKAATSGKLSLILKLDKSAQLEQDCKTERMNVLVVG